MHGIPWIFGMFISIIYANLNNWPTSKINFLNLIIIGLFFDLALIGLLKILFIRDRPNKRKIFLGAPIIDNYSFPSGHVSRATMISICFIIIIKLNYFNFVIILFPLILAFSRVLSGEHFISDVIAGLLIGCFEAFIFIILMQERLKKLFINLF